MTMHDQRFDRALPAPVRRARERLHTRLSRGRHRARLIPTPASRVDVPRKAASRGYHDPGGSGRPDAVAPTRHPRPHRPPPRRGRRRVRRRPTRPLPCPAVRPRRERRYCDGARRRHRDRGSREGTVTPIISGPEVGPYAGLLPRRHADRLRTERRCVGATCVLIMIANADGTGLFQATPEPLRRILWWTLSPDGRDLLVTTSDPGVSKLTILRRRRPARPLPVDIPPPAHRLTGLEPASYRPPDGREILVLAQLPGSATRGIYAVDASTRQPPG